MHSAAYAARLIPVGIFQPLDKARLPNWKHLDPEVLARFEYYDPGLRYGVPYMWGTTGFTYNVDMIRERMPDAPGGQRRDDLRSRDRLPVCRLRGLVPGRTGGRTAIGAAISGG